MWYSLTGQAIETSRCIPAFLAHTASTQNTRPRNRRIWEHIQRIISQPFVGVAEDVITP